MHGAQPALIDLYPVALFLASQQFLDERENFSEREAQR